jgi:hypothetical protein
MGKTQAKKTAGKAASGLEGARRTVEAEVRNIYPDYCWTPDGAVEKLVPYDITGKLTLSVVTEVKVHFTGDEVFTMKSKVPHVVGDEKGTGGGYISGVNKGSCRPITHSRTVKAGGAFVIRHTSLFFMNCNGNGRGNTLGKLHYVKTQGGVEATEPDLSPEDVEKAVNKTLLSQLGSKERSWWSKVGKEFQDKVGAIAKRLGASPNDLMAVMALETGGKFTSDVPNGGRVGLIQMGPGEAGRLGTTTAQLAKMTPVQQLDYVEGYLNDQPGIKAALAAGRPLTADDISLAVFHPAPVGKDGVLYRRGESGYSGNSGLDTNKDGKITVYERMAPIRKLLEDEKEAEAREAEVKAGIRVSGPKPAGGKGTGATLRTRSVQAKLLPKA